MNTVVMTTPRENTTRKLFANYGYEPFDEHSWTMFYKIYVCDLQGLIEACVNEGIHFEVKFERKS